MARASWIAVWVAGSGFLAVCQTPPEHKDSAPTVAVFLDFESAPGMASVEIMKREVDSLLKPSGVFLDWRLAGENHGDQSFASLVLLKFRGTCQVETWRQSADDAFVLGQTKALGSTKVENGHVLPFSEVKCDEVKQALSYLHPGADRSERQKAFGLAMGRVVAHELYHVFARTTTHAGHGLARAAESLQDLVSSQGMPFRAEESEAIRRGLSH